MIQYYDDCSEFKICMFILYKFIFLLSLFIQLSDAIIACDDIIWPCLAKNK